MASMTVGERPAERPRPRQRHRPRAGRLSVPGPAVQNTGDDRARWSVITSADRPDTFGLGGMLLIATGNLRAPLGALVDGKSRPPRVPYPMGFHAKGPMAASTIPTPAGRARLVWSMRAVRPNHRGGGIQQGGQFQLRPDPLASGVIDRTPLPAEKGAVCCNAARNKLPTKHWRKMADKNRSPVCRRRGPRNCGTAICPVPTPACPARLSARHHRRRG